MKTKWYVTFAIAVISLLSHASAKAQDDSHAPLRQQPATVEPQGRYSEAKSVKAAPLARLEGIAVRSGKDGIGFEIRLERPVMPNSTLLTDPYRLVLDFPDTISTSPRNHIVVGRDGVSSARIGVQPGEPPVTRVVLDLEKPRSYQLKAAGNNVIVTLGPPSVKPTSPDVSGAASAPDSPGRDDLALLVRLNNTSPQKPADTSNLLIPGSVKADSGEAKRPDAGSPPPSPTSTDTGAAALKGGPLDQSANSAPAESAANVDAATEKSKGEEHMRPLKGDIMSTAERTGGTESATPEPPHFGLESALISSDRLVGSAPRGAPSSTATAGLPLSLPVIAVPDIPEPVRDATKPGEAVRNEYVIGEQDILAITVWKEKDLSAIVGVRGGKITLPLLNDIKVVGLTPSQLRAILIEKLKPFLSEPEVTVAVREIHSRYVLLVGEVGKTGAFSLNNPATVLQMLAEAGGLREFAKRKGIYVLRREGGRQIRFAFNYDQVIRGNHMEQNIALKPGDMIVVP